LSWHWRALPARILIPGGGGAYNVSGSVSDSSEEGVEEALVQLTQSGEAVEEAATDAGGEYTIKRMPAGWYTLVITLDGYKEYESEPFEVDGNVTAPDARLWKTGESLPGYKVSGTISKSDGGNAAGARVKLRQDGVAVDEKAVDAGDGGVYAIEGVPAGQYSIEVSLAGYDLGPISQFTVSNSDVTGKNTMLIKPVHTVSGTVVVGDTYPPVPVPGATVILKGKHRPSARRPPIITAFTA
jgi:hypothetical protein